MDFLAIAAPGTEGIVAAELSALGIRPRRIVNGGVEFRGESAEMMSANLKLRVATRIVVRIAEFHASSFHELERRVRKVEWARFLSKDSLFRFRVTAKKSKLYHSDAVAERLGLAASRATGAKVIAPKADDEDETLDLQRFVVRIADDNVTISADSSGELLHRRGYRQAVAKAPLRETLAAAMVLGSEWDMKSPLVDPMCGSGTIPIEAAMMARRIAPGINRSFAFERWGEHDGDAWNAMKREARGAEQPQAGVKILASDRDGGATRAGIENATRAGVEGDIEISERAISAVEFPDAPGWIISNPPYGVRLGDTAPLRNLYSQLGKLLRGPANGYVLSLLSADRQLESQIGVRMHEVFRTSNGGIPVRLITTDARRQKSGDG